MIIITQMCVTSFHSRLFYVLSFAHAVYLFINEIFDKNKWFGEEERERLAMDVSIGLLGMLFFLLISTLQEFVDNFAGISHLQIYSIKKS